MSIGLKISKQPGLLQIMVRYLSPESNSSSTWGPAESAAFCKVRKRPAKAIQTGRLTRPHSSPRTRSDSIRE